MKTTLLSFLKTARDNGLNLHNLIDMAEKEAKYDTSIDFSEIENVPVLADLLSESAIEQTAKSLNGEKMPGRIPGKL